MRRVIAAVGVVVAVGCSTPMAQLKKELDPRASEELNCSVDKLQYVEIDRFISTTKVAVQGCGRKRVYKLVESSWKKAEDENADFNGALKATP